ncbi:hypothetical protein FKP32DRAFT_1731405 [Trametes sanguinea]|nr:hypothetical protein FKP32DRAFT_1731405 [Trametes sanguinea]
MVYRTSRKRAKYTYAERVLGALSEIQKDHRKHAVHMATLRAHVRKTADARKDKMGPQWSQWVSRAVNKLADDGILDTSDPHGNVTFTPNAKKTITKVRRESMGPGVALSPGLERKIWKDVTRRLSGAGVKRRRRRSSVNQPSMLDVDEWDDVETPPRKKQARKSSSRMTKAELEAQLEDALVRLREVEESQPAEPEDTSVLQEELAEREKEVTVLREELAKLKDRPPMADRRVTVGTSTSMLTPPRTNPSLPSSSRSAATAPRSRSAAYGVTRTLSGSLISNLSKQPTPEPSDAGSQGSEVDELVYDDMEDSSMSVFPEVAEAFSRPALHHGLATPQSSPLLGDQEDFPADDTQSTSHGSYHAHGMDQVSKLSSLKSQLEAQSAQLEHLRQEYCCSMEERESLRKALASRDDRMRVLESDLRARDAALEASKSARSHLEQVLAAETQRRSQVEGELSASQSALLAEQQRSAALEGKTQTLQDACEGLREENRLIVDRLESMASQLQAAQAEASKWHITYLEKEKKLVSTELKLTNVSEELRSAREEFVTLKVALERSDALLVEQTAEHEGTKATLAGIRDELAQTTSALQSSLASQEIMSSRIAELQRSLEDAVQQARALSDAKISLERASGDLQETLEELGGRLSHTEAELQAAREEAQQSQKVINELHATEAEAARETSSLKTAVSELELTVDKLRSELDDSAAEVGDLRRSLETEQASRRAAESELHSVQATCDKLLSDLADKTARVSSLTKERDALRQAQDELHRDLECTKAQHAEHLAAYAAEKTALEDALATARAAMQDLEAQVDGLNTRLSSLSEELTSVTVERDELSAELHEVRQRSAELEDDLKLARDDVVEAEKEIEELREAKAEDEASIQNLKSGLAKLRQLQMDALNEVDSKVRQMIQGFST